MAQDLSKLIAGIQKDLGGAALVSKLSDVEAPFETRIPTGIMSLDLALKGGFPAGSMHQIFGPDGSGKDYLTNLMIAQVQKKYGDDANIAWMSFGYRPDKPFMEMAGIDLNVGNLLYIDIGEKIALDHPAESLLSAMLRIIRSNQFQLVIINELGSGETRHNVAKDLHEDAKIATWASLLSSFCQKFYSAMRMPDENGDANKTCCMMISPVRANLNAHSAKFNPYTQGGGFALKHAKAVDLHIKPGGTIRKGTAKIGKDIKWKISKGKHGISEGQEGSYQFIFNEGVDLVTDLVNTAKITGAVRNKGRYFYVLDFEDRIEGGIQGVVDLIRKSPSTESELRDAVLREISGEDSDHSGGSEEAG